MTTLNYRQAREFLGLSRRKMDALVAKGAIPGMIETDNGKTRFEIDKISDFTASEAFGRLAKSCGGTVYPLEVENNSLESEEDRKITVIKAQIGRSEEDDPQRAAFFAELSAKRRRASEIYS